MRYGVLGRFFVVFSLIWAGRSPARADIRTSSARQQPRQQPRQQQRQPTPWLEMAAGSAEEDPEMNVSKKSTKGLASISINHLLVTLVGLDGPFPVLTL